MHRKSVSARTFQDSCNVQDSDKIKHCSQHYYLISLHSSQLLPSLCVFWCPSIKVSELNQSSQYRIKLQLLASAAIAKAVIVLTFCCSSTNPEDAKHIITNGDLLCTLQYQSQTSTMLQAAPQYSELDTFQTHHTQSHYNHAPCQCTTVFLELW
jgi:hypothetical protein